MTNTQTKIGWVRTTKTGSSFFENSFLRLYKKGYVIGLDAMPHCLTTASFDPNIFPIMTVRSPVDRFISVFNYYLYGSNLYSDVHTKNLIFERTDDIYKFCQKIFPAINQLGPIKYYQEYFQKHITADGKNDYIWKAHIDPLTEWIKTEDYHRTIIVCYDPFMIPVCKITAKYLYEELDFPLIPDISPQRVNQTIKYHRFNDKETAYIEGFVREYYASDYELLDKIGNRPELFKKVINRKATNS